MTLNELLARIVEAYNATVTDRSSRNALLRDWEQAVILYNQTQDEEIEPVLLADTLVISDTDTFLDDGVLQ